MTESKPFVHAAILIALIILVYEYVFNRGGAGGVGLGGANSAYGTLDETPY